LHLSHKPLSGSGSTFFNLAYGKDANRLAKKLEENFPHFKVFVCDFDNTGIKVED
jgi:homoserine kinase